MPDIDDIVPEEPPARGTTSSLLTMVGEHMGQSFRVLLTADKTKADKLAAKLRNAVREQPGRWSINQRAMIGVVLSEADLKGLDIGTGDKAFGVWIKRVS